MTEHRTLEWLAALPPGLRAAVEAAAVLEVFDAAALGALLDTPAEALLDDLRANGLIQTEGASYRLDAGAQAAALAALHAAPARLHGLYEHAARHYATGLAATPVSRRAAVERVYMDFLERYCEALIQQEPTALAEAAGAARLDLLAEPRHQRLLRFYRGLGAGLRENYETALAEFERLLAEPDLDDAIRGRALNSGAVFARHQGDYERALEGYRQSQRIWERMGNPARQGLALMNQGNLNHMLQDYEAAEHDLHASLNLFRAAEAHHSAALAQMNLGLLARDLGRWQEALSYFDQAAALFQREGATNFLGHIANNVGEVELLRGRLDVARAQFEQALEQMTTRVYAVDVHLNLGLLDQAQGDDTAALDRYRAALDLALDLGRHEIVALIRYRIGHAEQRLGQLDAARASYNTAIEAIEATRTPIRDEGLLISLMGRWQQVYEAVIQLCLERGDGAAAFDYAERARARAFADMLARRRSPAESAGGLDRASAVPMTASEVQAAMPPGTLLLAYFAAGLRGPESALLDAIPATAAGLRACLATPARLLLLALTHESLRAYTCPLDPNALQASSPYLADGRRFLNPAVLRRAYDALVAPVADLLATAERVVVVPHGPLHQMPFSTLLDTGGQPLLETRPDLACAPSATVLLRALDGRSTHPPQSCLALGYDGVAGRRLRHTVAEAAAVARLCGGTAWRGAPGMAAELRAAAGVYRWLHLACHGEFDLDDPLRSWLEIGPGERLSAADVIADFALDAELVVLSACRSGVSRVLRGDEPLGLVRAFLSAGARAVLVTLWPVEDSSARLLMERFYQALQVEAASDPAAALQIAQRYLRGLTLAEARDVLAGWGEDVADIASDDLATRPYADPAFWAAYVLVGGGG
jgi:CHAT domain-containing protein/tetratricopeptide (TPR) repeat protein